MNKLKKLLKHKLLLSSIGFVWGILHVLSDIPHLTHHGAYWNCWYLSTSKYIVWNTNYYRNFSLQITKENNVMLAKTIKRNNVYRDFSAISDVFTNIICNIRDSSRLYNK